MGGRNQMGCRTASSRGDREVPRSRGVRNCVWGCGFRARLFEFDPSKSQANKAGHDIDFKEALALWPDENRIEIPARTSDEDRFLVIGTIAGKCWSGVVTYLGDVVRIISVRRSRSEEESLYEGESE
jgi:uncharacterized protein